MTSTKQRNHIAARVLAALCAAGIGLGCLPARADNLPLIPDLNATAAPAFDPAEALCKRQTFLLASIEEAPLWFRYVADLRSGAAQLPSQSCPSSTLKAIYAIQTSPDAATADGQILGLFRSYMAQAMTEASSERAIDMEGTYRYRVDATALSLLWMSCPSGHATQTQCARDRAQRLPIEYTSTSPVFCDFATAPLSDVETGTISVELAEELPGMCTAFGGGAPDPDGWAQSLSLWMGDG